LLKGKSSTIYEYVLHIKVILSRYVSTANVQVRGNTVDRVRKRLVEGGVEHALTEANCPGHKSKLEGKSEATIIALACSDPPTGASKL
jgi:hypothetical protein